MSPDGLAAVRGMVAKVSVTTGLLYGGLIFAFITIFLPWVSISVMGFEGPAGDFGPHISWKYAALLVIVAAGWFAWPTVSGSPMPVKPFNYLIGLTIAVGLLAGVAAIGFFAILSFSSKYGAMTEHLVDVGPGFGLYLYAVAVIATAAGVVLLWTQRPQTTAMLPPPPPPSSPLPPPPPPPSEQW
jgi:hypothetical protein